MCLKISLILKAERASCVRSIFDLNLWHTILGIRFWMIRSTFVQRFLLSNLTSKWRPNAQGLASYYKHNIQQQQEQEEQKLQGNTYLRLTVTTHHEHAPFTVTKHLSPSVTFFGFCCHSTISVSTQNTSQETTTTTRTIQLNKFTNPSNQFCYKDWTTSRRTWVEEKTMKKTKLPKQKDRVHIKWQTFS